MEPLKTQQPRQQWCVHMLPNMLALQAAHLRDLNRRGDAEAVIRLYESGALQSTEAATGEYIKALVNVERLDTSRLMGTIQVSSLAAGQAGSEN